MERLIDLLKELKQDQHVSKNVSDQISSILKILSSNEEENIKKDKILQTLENVSSNQSLDSYSRTQLLNIISEVEATY